MKDKEKLLETYNKLSSIKNNFNNNEHKYIHKYILTSFVLFVFAFSSALYILFQTTNLLPTFLFFVFFIGTLSIYINLFLFLFFPIKKGSVKAINLENLSLTCFFLSPIFVFSHFFFIILLEEQFNIDSVSLLSILASSQFLILFLTSSFGFYSYYKNYKMAFSNYFIDNNGNKINKKKIILKEIDIKETLLYDTFSTIEQLRYASLYSQTNNLKSTKAFIDFKLNSMLKNEGYNNYQEYELKKLKEASNIENIMFND